MNDQLQDFARNKLKKSLSLCSPAAQLIFKRMYSHKNLELHIDKVVDNMPDDKLDWAMRQVEKTLEGKDG